MVDRFGRAKPGQTILQQASVTLPRIQQFYSAPLYMLNVSGDQRHSVVECGCGDLVVDLEPAQPKLELGCKDRIGRPNLLDSPADFANDNDAGEQVLAVD
jgi:hypothetical protein